jgi:hypothetical protein
MDATYYDDITGRLHGLLIRVADRLPRGQQLMIVEYIEVNELGLALEQMAYALAEDERALDPAEREDMLALAETMGNAERILRELSFCPSSS